MTFKSVLKLLCLPAHDSDEDEDEDEDEDGDERQKQRLYATFYKLETCIHLAFTISDQNQMAILYSSLLLPFFFLLLITPSTLSFLSVAQTLTPTPVCTQQPDDLHKAHIVNGSCSNSLNLSSKGSGPSSNPLNQTSKHSSGSLPISFNLTSKGSGSFLNSYNQTSTDGKSSSSNSSNMTSKDGGSSSNSSSLTSNIWAWNGRLHCYGRGCLSPLSSSTTTTTTTSSSSSQPQIELGIPCSYAIELLSIAGHQDKTSHAIWVPSSSHTPSSHYNHSQTWKIRFDSLHKGNSIPPKVELRASILQDGPMNSSTQLQFALRGPWKAPHRGGCYYAITLAPFAIRQLLSIP